MFNIKIKKKDSLALIGAIFNGLSALDIPENTYLQVIDAESDKNSIGSILKKLDNKRHPFRTVKDSNGTVYNADSDRGFWGDGIENYVFKIVAYIEK